MRIVLLTTLLFLVSCDPPTTPETNVSLPKPRVKTSSSSQPISQPSPAPPPAAAETIESLRAENLLLRRQLETLQAVPPTQSQIAPETPAYREPTVQPTGTLSLLPPRGQSLTAEQRAMVLTDTIPFHPGSIPSSNLPIGETSVLSIGQEVQMKWGSTWWAATIVGFEADGGVRTHYFGWESTYDEIVPRSDLQLDTNTKDKALQTIWPAASPESR